MHDSRGIQLRQLLVQTVGQLAVLTSLACAHTAVAQDLNFTPVGTWPGPIVDLGSGVAVVGRHAFVTGGGHRPGLCVFDVGEAAPPRLIASLTTDRLPGMVPEIAVSGNYAFITEGDGRMLVVDVSDPTRPQMLTAFDTSGPVDHLAVAGSYAFLAGASFSRDTPDAPPGMVQIIDISDPAHPRQVSSYAMAPISADYFGMSAVASDGQFLCIAYHDTGSTAMLEVVDVRDPAAPRRVGVYEAPGGVNGGGVNALAVGNGRAYFAPYTLSATFTRLSRLEVIDLADPTGPKRLGSLSTTGEVRSLALAGQYLYAAKDTYPGAPVDIINMADPAKPVRIGGFGDSTQDSPYIAVAEGKACIRTGGGLISYDVSEPTVMRRLGTLSTGYATADVAVAGSHAIVADGGLQVLDVSQPANPRRIGGFKTTEYAHRVVVLGNHAYLAAGDLMTFDLNQPANPRRTSSIDADAKDIVIAGKALCVVGYGSDLQVFDISNPAVPRRVGLRQVRYPDGYKWVAASSNHVFVASTQSSPPASAVEVFDVGIPSTPQWVASYEPVGSASGIAVAGNLAVLVGTAYVDPQDTSRSYGFVEVLDVTDPGYPTLIASQTLDEESLPGSVTILDNCAFVGVSGKDPLGMVGRLNNLVVLDLSEPTRPRRVGSYKSAGRRVALSGGYLFATASYSGLSVLQVRAAAVDLSTALEVGGKAFGVAAEGSFGCVAAGEAGLQVLNLNDPSRPVVSGNLPTDGTAWDAALANGRAYIAAGEAGLMIADISTPANPQRLGGVDTPGDARSVLVTGTIAYVADGAEGVQVVDVSDPLQPRRLGGHGTTGWATGLALHGTHLLVACREAGLLVLNVSDPTNPQSVATYNRGGHVVAVTTVGTRAIVSDGVAGLTILDLTAPANLKRIGGAPGHGYARGIAVSGRFAYVADDRAGVQVYDLADPVQPRHLGGNTALEAYRLVVSGGRLFAAGGQRGLGVFNLYTPPLNVVASSTQTSGSLSLQVDGPAGASARIQRSADLSTWQDWQTLTLGEVPQTLSDAVTTSQMQMFYRAVSP